MSHHLDTASICGNSDHGSRTPTTNVRSRSREDFTRLTTGSTKCQVRTTCEQQLEFGLVSRGKRKGRRGRNRTSCIQCRKQKRKCRHQGDSLASALLSNDDDLPEVTPTVDAQKHHSFQDWGIPSEHEQWRPISFDGCYPMSFLNYPGYYQDGFDNCQSIILDTQSSIYGPEFNIETLQMQTGWMSS